MMATMQANMNDQEIRDRHYIYVRSLVNDPYELETLLGGKEKAAWFFNVFHGRIHLRNDTDRAAYQEQYEIVSEAAEKMMKPIPEQPDYDKRKEDLIDIALCVAAVVLFIVARKAGII